MVIGICALGALSEDTGGRTYIVNLSKTLQFVAKHHTVIFFMSYGESDLLDLHHANFSVVEIKNSANSYQRIFAEHVILPFLIKKHKIDVMYFPGNFSSYFCPAPYVLAIRSMLVYNPQLQTAVNWTRNLYRKLLYPRSAKRARHIITPSYHTKEEIMKFLNIHPDKISVIPHGIDTELFSRTKDSALAETEFKKYGIHLPFLLYVSALWEYKNQDKLILAFSKLIREKNIPHQLVLIGRGMNSYESYASMLRSLVSSQNLSTRVLFIDFLPHEILRHFYQHADVFVFPSAMESFGNSLFEAMAAGTPVVCSNKHGFPSLVQDAALLVNPYDIDTLADSILSVLTTPPLRDTLVNNGKSLSKSLSWQSCVEKTFAHIINEP